MWFNSMETLVKADRFWHEVFLSRIVMQKKFRQYKIDHDLYGKQKSVGGFDTKIHATYKITYGQFV